jgi:Patatin-like phospholipase
MNSGPTVPSTPASPKARSKKAAKNAPSLSLADVLEDELAGKCLIRESKQVSEEKMTREQKQLSEEKMQERMNDLHKRLHKEGRSALCLSGGGIRSATFGLGVLQALAKKGLLGEFDYLSTVSGGGYIGGWLSAWIKQNGLASAIAGLNKDLRTSPDDKRDPESEPIRHLRRYSNYLTPRLGITSADTWTLAATIVRNVFLNWLMLIPLLAAVLMVPRLFLGLGVKVSWWKTNEMTGVWIWAVISTALLLTLLATAYSAADLPKWRSNRIAKVTQGRYILLCLLPMILSACLISFGWFWWRAALLPGATLFFNWIVWPGISSFVLGLWAASALGGGIALAAVRKFKIDLREWSGVLATAAAGGISLWWVLTWVFGALEPHMNDAVRLNYFCFAPSLVLLVFLLMNFFYVGTLSNVTVSEDREWWASSSGWILVAALCWAAISAIAIWGPIALMALFQDKTWLKGLVAALGGTTGIVTALVGHSTATAGPKQESKSRSGLWLTLGAVVFILFLLVGISFGTSWVLAKLLDFPTTTPAHPPGVVLDFRAFYPSSVVVYPTLYLLGLFAALALCGLIVGYFINVNQFSLHAMYRSRLIRAFLGASRGASRDNKRKPHWFTGFDPDDNIDMHKLADPPPGKLFHIVNTAMNLVSGKELAWQERMAQSFTISPLHSGNWTTGYRRSKEYALGIGLGTAITISGAAASPNMGYHSSPLVTFLMTLFNVRLGWWVANPGPPGKGHWQDPGPRHATWPLICEAFGYTTDEFTYVNLSDGGHFENLGLYEMVLRRCRHIVVIDAGRDTNYAFEDLGNALRKIRIDFGIDIEISIKMVAPDKEMMHLARYAVGRIRYDKVDPTGKVGELIYIKPVLREGEPVDVYNYRKAHPEFPHETTNDQWFSESQLESYRMLGKHTIEEMCHGAPKLAELRDFFWHVAKS